MDGVSADAVLANLPYVAEGAELPPEITRYEPRGRAVRGRRRARRDPPRGGRGGRSDGGRCWRSRSGPSRPSGVASCCGTRALPRWRSATTWPGCARGGGHGVSTGHGREAEGFERCMSVGGVAVFPADTVYGLACDVHNRVAVERLYRLKRRRLDKPSAVMFFDRELALAALPELGERTRAALGAPAARAGDRAAAQPRAPLPAGLRRGPVDVRAAGARGARCWRGSLAGAAVERQPRRRPRRAHVWTRCPRSLRRSADLVHRRRRAARHAVDGGRPARPTRRPGSGRSCARGRVARATWPRRCEWQFHFDPASYAEMIRADIPVYDEFQEARGAARAARARRGCSSWGRGRGRPPGGCWRAIRTRCWWASTRARRCWRRLGRRLPAGSGVAAGGRDRGATARGAVRSGGQRAVRPPPARAR